MGRAIPFPLPKDDAKTERIVLAHHPAPLTMPELAAEVLEDPDDFAEGDALARAVRDLCAAGLVRMNGAVVMPTRAALHFRPPQAMIEVARRFGDNLVRCRKRAGLSQEELALRPRFTAPRSRVLERGGRCPRIDTLAKLAGALDVSADELFADRPAARLCAPRRIRGCWYDAKARMRPSQ